jgi:hypothetical protein
MLQSAQADGERHRPRCRIPRAMRGNAVLVRVRQAYFGCGVKRR